MIVNGKHTGFFSPQKGTGKGYQFFSSFWLRSGTAYFYGISQRTSAIKGFEVGFNFTVEVSYNFMLMMLSSLW